MSAEINGWLNSVLAEIGWSLKDLEKTPHCSKERQFLYNENSETESTNNFYNESSRHVVEIKLSDHDLQKITSSKNVTRNSTLTSDEQLKVYDYCVKKAKIERENRNQNDKGKSFLDSNFYEKGKEKLLKNEPPSELELKIREREMKRRRQSYKNKKVYSSNRNYKEVLRHVIEGQMEMVRQEMENKHINYQKK